MTKKILNGLMILLFMGFYSKLPAQVKTIEVNKNWVFSEVGKNTWLPANVPGCVHTDLLNNKKIDDPFFRINEKKLQWIDKSFERNNKHA
jgi:beta-mannosidase